MSCKSLSVTLQRKHREMNNLKFFIILCIALFFIVACNYSNTAISSEEIQFCSITPNDIDKMNHVLEDSVHLNIELIKVHVDNVHNDLKPISDAATAVPIKIQSLLNKINKIRIAIVNKSEGISVLEKDRHIYEKAGIVKFSKNRDEVENGFITDCANSKVVYDELILSKEGENLKQILVETRKDLLKTIYDLINIHNSNPMKYVAFDGNLIESLEKRLPLEKISNEQWKDKGFKSWSEEKFGNKSIALCYLELKKIEDDAKSSVAKIVSYLSSGVMFYAVNQYNDPGNIEPQIISVTQNRTIKIGETYKAYVSLGLFTNVLDFTVSINGSHIPVEQGKARYTIKPNSIGVQNYKVRVNFANRKNGKVSQLEKNFSYEVLPN